MFLGSSEKLTITKSNKILMNPVTSFGMNKIKKKIGDDFDFAVRILFTSFLLE